MTRFKLTSLLVGVALGFIAGAYGVAYVVASGGRPAAVAVDTVRPLTDVPDAATQISFWSKRVSERADPYLDLTLLGQAFSRKARETSDVGYYVRAEKALREALRINPEYVPASTSLSTVLFSLHDFEAALRVARPVAHRADGLPALATIGDVQLALGRYSQARATYARLRSGPASPAVYSRLAFLADLHGRTEQALAYMSRAAVMAEESGDAGESLAWYVLQTGQLAFKAGRLELAESHFRAALELFPAYPLALGSLARAKAAQGDHEAAIRLYERAVAIAPQPELVAALGDLYAAAGSEAKAREQFATVEVIARLAEANRQVYNRQLAMFYADRGTNPRDAARLALGELRVRKDVYGYDAAAWVLARSGRCAEALPLARRSLKLGTKDALLYFHRGYTEGCAGNGDAMRTWYGRALELNHGFSVRWAPVARSELNDRSSA